MNVTACNATTSSETLIGSSKHRVCQLTSFVRKLLAKNTSTVLVHEYESAVNTFENCHGSKVKNWDAIDSRYDCCKFVVCSLVKSSCLLIGPPNIRNHLFKRLTIAA